MRSVVLSIAVHVVLGAIVIMKVREHVIVAPVVAAAEPAPIEVEIYVEPPVVAIARAPEGSGVPISHAPSRAPSGDAAVVAAPSTRASESPVSVAAPHVVSVPSPHDAAVAANMPSKVESAAPTTTTTNTFRMRVDADGNAHVTDRRNFQWGRGGSIGYIEEAKAERWLDEHHEQSNVVDTKLPPLTITVATFDVTDAAMRLAGQDPYASEKLKVLDATRDERAQIGARHRERQLVDTPALVRASLAEIARLPAGQRDAAIRELYVECDDSSAGEVARHTIAEYVRARGLAIDLAPR